MKDAFCWSIHGKFPQGALSKLLHLLSQLSSLTTETEPSSKSLFPLLIAIQFFNVDTEKLVINQNITTLIILYILLTCLLVTVLIL